MSVSPEREITISDIDRLQAALHEFETAQAVLRKVESPARAGSEPHERSAFEIAREKLTRALGRLESEVDALDARAQLARSEKAWSNH